MMIYTKIFLRICVTMALESLALLLHIQGLLSDNYSAASHRPSKFLLLLFKNTFILVVTLLSLLSNCKLLCR